MKRSFRPDLLLIIILLVVMNIPMLTGRTPFDWDTFNMPYEEFVITYNALVSNGSLPLWLPYSSYGIPNYFWLAALSIVNILFIGIGVLFRIQNTIILFRASLLGEQLISVFGMYLLAKQIFKGVLPSSSSVWHSSRHLRCTGKSNLIFVSPIFFH